MPKRAGPGSAPSIKTPKRATPTDSIPPVIADASLDAHLEIITRAIFQAGLSWAMIAERWDVFRGAFDKFDVDKVAAYGEFDLERLMETDGIIHSAKKIAGTFENARTLIALNKEFGSVTQYVSTFDSYRTLFADAHRRFAFMGDLSCYYWLFRTANPVPPFEEWIARQERDHPRMREMVSLARANGVSSERTGFLL